MRSRQEGEVEAFRVAGRRPRRSMVARLALGLFWFSFCRNGPAVLAKAETMKMQTYGRIQCDRIIAM